LSTPVYVPDWLGGLLINLVINGVRRASGRNLNVRGFFTMFRVLTGSKQVVVTVKADPELVLQEFGKCLGTDPGVARIPSSNYRLGQFRGKVEGRNVKVRFVDDSLKWCDSLMHVHVENTAGGSVIIGRHKPWRFMHILVSAVLAVMIPAKILQVAHFSLPLWAMPLFFVIALLLVRCLNRTGEEELEKLVAAVATAAEAAQDIRCIADRSSSET
jgi:hypothetical protein